MSSISNLGFKKLPSRKEAHSSKSEFFSKTTKLYAIELHVVVLLYLFGGIVYELKSRE